MNWQYEEIRLSFRIGAKTLGQSRIKGMNCHAHISQLTPADARQPPEQLMKSHKATLARLATCPIEKPLPILSRAGGWYRYVPEHFPHFLTEIKGDFDAYLSRTFSRNARKKFRRIINRWSRRQGGEIRWREYRTLDEIREFLPLARTVSEKTMQHRLLNRGITEGGRREAAILEEARNGVARGYLLFDGDQPVVYNYGYLSPGGVMTLEYGGYDPALRDWSIGTLLDYLVIQRAHDDPEIHMIDFGEGDGEYKKRFSTREMQAAHVLFFKPTPKNLALIGAHLATSRFSSGFRALLIRLDLLEKAKQLAGQTSKPRQSSA